MFKFNLYYATVIDNSDPDKAGKIQIKILPEFNDIRDSDLPWAKPFFNMGMSAKEFNKITPKKDSKIWVLADIYFEEIFYLSGVYIDGFFDYASVKDKIDEIDETSSTSSPNIDFIKFDNDNILFNNIVNGDIGILHTSGSYYLIKSDGKIYMYNGTIKIKIEDDTIETEGSSTFTLAGDTFELGGNTKSLVTHAELNSALQNLINALNLHQHPTAATGPPSPPSTPMSINISASEAKKIKTS